MKSFLLSMVMLAALSGTAFADSNDDYLIPLPDLTVEPVEESVTTTLEVASQFVNNVALPIATEIGPQADMVILNMQSAIALLDQQTIDMSELLSKGEKIAENYTLGRKLFFKGKAYRILGDVLVDEAKSAEGTAAYVLRVKAAAYYYEGAVYLERSRVALNNVLEIGMEMLTLVEELTIELEEKSTKD